MSGKQGKQPTEHPMVPLVSASSEPSVKVAGTDTSAVKDQHPDQQVPALVKSGLPQGIHDQQVIDEQEGLTKPRRDIWVERLVLDIYEYRGLHELGVFVFFFLISSFFLYSQWGTTTATFKNTVVESLVSYDAGNDWESRSLGGLGSMSDAYEYMTGWMANAVNRTEALNISARDANVVFVGENAAIRYARLLALFDDKCQYRVRKSAFEKRTENNSTACWVDSRKFAPLDYDLRSFLQPQQSGWQKLEVECNQQVEPWCVTASPKDKKKGWFATELLTPLTPRTALLARLDPNNITSYSSLPFQEKVISKYAVALQLAVLAEDRFGRDAAAFTLTVRLGGKSKQLIHRVGTWSVNHPDHLSPGLHSQFRTYQAFFFLLTLYYIILELRKWRLCWLQHRSMGFYFRYWWNWTQIISHVLNVIWIFWCWSLHFTEQTSWPIDLASYALLERDADAYTLYLYFGIVVNLLLGICMCRYMRIHMGLKAFYQVFVDAGRSLIDFAVFVVYIILVLGSATFAFFQISGGNAFFITFPSGLSAMGRLPFQFLDYSDFQNDGVGLGNYAWTVTGLFWLTVIFLILFTQNTLLAIFNLAYMNARKKSLKVELSFISLVVNRIIFMFLYYGIRIAQLWTTLRKAREQADPIKVRPPTPPAGGEGSPGGGAVRADAEEVEVLEEVREHLLVRWWRLWRDERYFMHEMILQHYSPTNPIRNHPRKLLFCRWCIACLTEMQAIAALYTDYATLKLQDTRNEDERPTWISLGGHQRRVITRGLGFLSASTLRKVPSITPEVVLESETQKEQYSYFSQNVPAWCGHVGEMGLVRLLQLLVRGRHDVGGSSNWLKTLFMRSPFDSLSVLEMPPLDPDSEAASGAPPAELLPNGKVVDNQLVRTIAESIMAVYVHTSKPIRDADGDGIDDEEDDPAELLRRFRKMYARDREADKAQLKEMQDSISEHLLSWKADMHELMDTLLRHPALRLRPGQTP